MVALARMIAAALMTPPASTTHVAAVAGHVVVVDTHDRGDSTALGLLAPVAQHAAGHELERILIGDVLHQVHAVETFVEVRGARLHGGTGHRQRYRDVGVHVVRVVRLDGRVQVNPPRNGEGVRRTGQQRGHIRVAGQDAGFEERSALHAVDGDVVAQLIAEHDVRENGWHC